MRHVDKRDDSKCPVQRNSKPLNEPGANDANAIADASAGGCTASPRPAGGFGGIAGLFGLLLAALLLRRHTV